MARIGHRLEQLAIYSIGMVFVNCLQHDISVLVLHYAGSKCKSYLPSMVVVLMYSKSTTSQQ